MCKIPLGFSETQVSEESSGANKLKLRGLNLGQKWFYDTVGLLVFRSCLLACTRT